MKKILEKAFYTSLNMLSWLTSLIIRMQVFDVLKLYINRTHWYAIKRQFASVGPGSYIASPFYVKNPHAISIGLNFAAQADFTIEAIEQYGDDKFEPQVTIGNNVSFYHSCHIGCLNRIDIGDSVLFGSRVYITDHFHGNTTPEDLARPPLDRKLFSKGPVVIKNNVWVGEGVAIMPGVTIGENAIIGANSVVTKNIPDNAVAAGVPAKIIKLLK